MANLGTTNSPGASPAIAQPQHAARAVAVQRKPAAAIRLIGLSPSPALRLFYGNVCPPASFGVYGNPKPCAAFMHMDSRGFITRWGSVEQHGRTKALNWWPPEEFSEQGDD